MTEKNVFKSNATANRVFGRERPATNSRYRSTSGSPSTKRASPAGVEERIKHGEKVIRAGSQHPETMSRMSERSPVYQAIWDAAPRCWSTRGCLLRHAVLMLTRLDHVRANVSDFRRAVDWYTTVLGFQVESYWPPEEPDDAHFASAGGATFALMKAGGR
jgi:hypothetical protein